MNYAVVRVLFHATVLTTLTCAFAGVGIAQTGVSDDRVSLPEGPGSLEGVGDDVAIDPNMGAMSYNVEIKLPMGFARVQPELGLSYSSSGGASIVGMGWSMKTSSIERLTLWGVPRYDIDDEWSDNGAQLVYVGGSEPRVYRARVEGSFARYNWYGHGVDGDGGYWLIEYSDGRRAWFGAAPSEDGSSATDTASARLEGPEGTFRYMLTEMRDRYDHAARYEYVTQNDGNLPLLSDIRWAFDDAGTARYAAMLTYVARYDKTRDATGGFEEIMASRLAGVRVTVAGEQLRRYALGYDLAVDSGGFTRLNEVQLYGADDAPYPVATTFGYSLALGEICRASNCEKPITASAGSIRHTLVGGNANIIDMNGDGLPDVLDSSAADGSKLQMYFNVPSTDGTFSFDGPHPTSQGTSPTFLLSKALVQMLDVNGDGFTDLVDVATGTALINEGNADFARTENLITGGVPTTAGSFAALRYVDIDNDRRIDLIGGGGTGGQPVKVYHNTDAGYVTFDGDPVDLPVDRENLEFDDFNGDGLVDIVWIVEDEVRFHLNLGRGRWSEQRGAMGGFDFTPQEQKDAELTDLNGDGLSDVVLVASSSVRMWINRSAEHFDPEQTIGSGDVSGPGIPTKESNTTVLFADINGNGSSDVVWVDHNGAVTYLELFPVKPNLLSRVSNGLGLVFDITYGTSIEHMAADQALGNDWAYKLPFPNIVVNQVVTADTTTGVSMETVFSYHDGYYDGVERQFRGYERVEQRFGGDDWQEEGESRMTYDVGVVDVYSAGHALSSETLSGDRSLKLVSHLYDECPIVGVDNSTTSRDVRYVCPVEVRTEIREGAAASDWVTLSHTMAYDGYGNLTSESNHGVVEVGGGSCAPCDRDEAGDLGAPCGDTCLGDETFVERTFITPGGDNPWIPSAVVSERTFGVEGSEDYMEITTFFDGAEFVGLERGQIRKGFISRQEQRLDADGGVIQGQRSGGDEHGNVVVALDPNGSVDQFGHHTYSVFSDDGLRLTRTDIAVEHADGDYMLRREYTYDAVWDGLTRVVNWHIVKGGEIASALYFTQWAYDNFGRTVAMVDPGGDTLEKPTIAFSYDVGAPSRVEIQRRSEVGGAVDIEAAACQDGRGNTTQEYTLLADGRYRVTGAVAFSPKGSEFKTYQPYVADSDACVTAPPSGVNVVTKRVDALERLLETVMPAEGDGPERTMKIEYAPLMIRLFAVDDTTVGHANYDTPEVILTDGLERKVAQGRTLTAGAEPEWFEMAYNEHGQLIGLIDPLGNRRSQAYDLLGRVIRTEDGDRGTTTYEYDANGNEVVEVDNAGFRHISEYDTSNRIVFVGIEGDDTSWASYLWDFDDGCPEGACDTVANRLVSVTYPTPRGEGRDWFRVDGRERTTALTRVVGGVTLAMETEFDNADRAVAFVYPGGQRVTVEVDAADRVSSVPGFLDSVHFPDSGNLSAIDFANGVSGAWEYNTMNQLTALSFVDAAGAKVAGLEYGRDVDERIIERRDLAISDDLGSNDATYLHDAFGRLLEVDFDLGRDQEEIITYAYDAADNLRERVSTVEGSPVHDGVRTMHATRPHALAQVGDDALVYDSTGNLVQRGDMAYEYDPYGRLRGMLKGGVEASEHVYANEFGRVYSMSGDAMTWFLSDDVTVVDGVGEVYISIGGGSVAKHQYAAGPLVLADVAPATGSDTGLGVNADGVVNAADAWLSYASETGLVTLSAATPSASSEVLAASANQGLIDFGERTTFLHRDVNHSVIAVTDGAGATVELQGHYPYGASRWSTTNASERLDWTSKRTDDASGQVHIGNRVYDPVIARWTTVDHRFATIGPDELNRPWEAAGNYLYCLGRPEECQDEDGEAADIFEMVRGFDDLHRTVENRFSSPQQIDNALHAALLACYPDQAQLVAFADRITSVVLIQDMMENPDTRFAMAIMRPEMKITRHGKQHFIASNDAIGMDLAFIQSFNAKKSKWDSVSAPMLGAVFDSITAKMKRSVKSFKALSSFGADTRELGSTVRENQKRTGVKRRMASLKRRGKKPKWLRPDIKSAWEGGGKAAGK